MKYNRFSRRMFLQGAGTVLAIPVLESLLPRALAQTMTPPVRYIQMLTPYCHDRWDFYTYLHDTTGLPNPSPSWEGNKELFKGVTRDPSGHAMYIKLSDIQIPQWADGAQKLSHLLGPEMTALRTKYSVIRGLSLQKTSASENIAISGDANKSPSTMHNTCYPSCASPNAKYSDYSSAPLSGQESADVIIANSSKVYPANFPLNRRHLVLGPGTGDTETAGRTFTWRMNAGVLQQVQAQKQTQAIKDLFFSTQQTGTTASAGLSAAMNAVYGDYAKIRNSSKLSAQDKQKLESYMAMVAQIRDNVTAPTGNACSSPPNLLTETSIEEQVRNQLNIVAAALACNQTRVVSLMNIFDRPDSHGASHGSPGTDTASYKENSRRIFKRLAYFISLLDGMTDMDGMSTLLSNSVIYYSSEFSIANQDGGHAILDYPCIIAGGGGGRIRQGYFIDYRQQSTEFVRPGIPLNNVLVTMMNCMGLSSADYEKTAGAGYGYYALANEGGLYPNETFWRSTAGRRTPLPFLYTGPSMG